MKHLSFACLLLLLVSVSLFGQQPTLGNNTAACGAPAPIYCSASFAGLPDTSGDPGLQTTLPVPPPPNVSTIDTHTLLYPGTTTLIVAHMQGWFCKTGDAGCSGSHVQIGYSSNDPVAVHAQMNDVVQRGIDAISLDWYGPGNATVDGALSAIGSDLSARFVSPSPTITGVSPASGPTAGGTAVTITGTNFRSGAAVTFAGVSATSIVVVNSTLITAVTPAGSAGAANVVVTNTDSTTGTLTGGFNYTSTVSNCNSYSTNFPAPPAPENPLSESGSWIDGGSVGLDWANVQTTAGKAFGTQAGVSPPPYNDSTAQLTGTWASSQTAQATVFSTSPTTGCNEEVELHLLATTSAHSAKRYEVYFRSFNGTSSYLHIARWNGALNNFTSLDSNPNGTQWAIKTGDVIKATANVTSSSTKITVYRNGTQIYQVTDSSAGRLTSGAPGMGFYNNCGTSTVNANYGFSSYTASACSPGQLVVSVPSGGGSVASSPAGVTCPGTCAATFAGGTSITLTATAASGWGLANWSGLCTGTTNPCTFTMPANGGSVIANFTPSGGGGGTGNYTILNLPPHGTVWFPNGIFEHKLPKAGNGGPTNHLMPNSDAVIAHVFSEASDGTPGVLPTSTSGGLVSGHFAAPGRADYNNSALYFGQATDPIYHITGPKQCGDYFEPYAQRDASGFITNLYFHAPSGLQFSGQNGSDQGIELWDESGDSRTRSGWQIALYGYGEGALAFPACSAGQTCTFNRSNGYCSMSRPTSNVTGDGACRASASNHMCGPIGMTYFSELESGHIPHASHGGTACEATAGGAEPAAVFPNHMGWGALPCVNRTEMAPPSASLYFLDYTDAQLACMNPAVSATCTGNNGLAIAKLNDQLQWTRLEQLAHYGWYEADTGGPNTSDAGAGIFTEHEQSSQSYLYYSTHGFPTAFTTVFQGFATWLNGQCSGSFTSSTNPCYHISGSITDPNTRWLERIWYGVPKNISGPTCSTSNACGILKHLHIADPCVAVALAGLSSATNSGHTWNACPQ